MSESLHMADSFSSFSISEAHQLVSQDLSRAISYIEQALKDTPKHPQAVEALALLAEAYYGLKRYPESAYLLESCTQLEPHNIEYWQRLAAFHLMRGNFTKAAGALLKFSNLEGLGVQLERYLVEKQAPKVVVRALWGLLSILSKASFDDLPPIKSLAELWALEEKLTAGDERADSSASLDSLPGVNLDLALRLRAIGVSNVVRLSKAAPEQLIELDLSFQQAELLIDIAASELYLAAMHTGRPL